ncbi:DUF1697 domain-containing protein [Actinomadura madurae]|uniref:DUF1697 domain-containing protein n=1 Tax=Actinomadura madurae TaxID=1993 RepID=UPI0020D260F4|nr:DUF1697 domain-containing protein [Actinomadura madurae]MCQ0003690.1 DUF1697 domain-containing protein [Actinomadura madurae]
MRYAALLRGINVGGNNTVPMAALRKVFEDAATPASARTSTAGTSSSTRRGPGGDLARGLEEAVRREFGVRTRILVLSADRVRRIAAGLPDDWERNDEWACNVLYLFPEQASPSALARFGADPEREEARYCAGAILHRVSRANVGRSALYRLGGDLNAGVTIRTARTARRLAALVAETGRQ